MDKKTRARRFFQILARVGVAAGVAASLIGPGSSPALAQKAGAANPVMMPGFWDPRRRPERPDLSRVTLIRFLTENDYPPFNYAGQDGNPAGFNVDLARMICEELKIACTIQMRRFDTLIDCFSKIGAMLSSLRSRSRPRPAAGWISAILITGRRRGL